MFSVVLFVPIFAVPFLVVYGPAKVLDSLVHRLKKSKDAETKNPQGLIRGESSIADDWTRSFIPGNKVQVCNQHEAWRPGVVKSVDEQGRPLVAADGDEDRQGVLWFKTRAHTHHEFTSLNSRFEETIFGTPP